MRQGDAVEVRLTSKYWFENVPDMAISWIAALKLIPWSDVISNAPMVADGARKLWSTVAKKPAAPHPASGSRAVVSTEAEAISALEVRVVAMESAVSELHTQMLASSELIQSLAQQIDTIAACPYPHRPPAGPTTPPPASRKEKPITSCFSGAFYAS